MSDKSSEASFLYSMPKLDLHCHLNGSISSALLAHLEVLTRQAAEGINTSHNQETRAADISLDDSDGLIDTAVIQNRASVLEDHVDPAERMKYCFGVFDNIYKIMTNASFTRLVVQDLLLHSAAEHIFVLEIRTSLRDGLYRTARAAACCNEAESLTKKAYMETVTATVEHLLRGGVVDFETGELIPLDVPLPPIWMSHFRKLYATLFNRVSVSNTTEVESFWQGLRKHLMNRMHIRLLLSINRGHSAAAAEEAVSLAKLLQTDQVARFIDALPDDKRAPSSLRDDARRVCWVTGVDFSGNCYKNRFVDFLPALEEARRAKSLGVTLHAGEKNDPAELNEMIAFAPERWGHLVFTDEAALATVVQRHDAIELCLTSNALTSGYSDMAQHHLSDIFAVAVAQAASATTAASSSSSSSPSSSICMRDLLTESASVESAMLCRVRRRMARWHTAAEQLGHTWIPTPLPNVSFSTDDRGVFETSITEELQRLMLHPTFNGADVATQNRAMYALQRLTVPHVFEMPLEIVLLCTRGWTGRTSAAALTAEVMAMRTDERAALSQVECQWLLEDFDRFQVE